MNPWPIALAADLHLRPGDPEGAGRFRAWLQEAGARARSLYLLGDLFDFWVGRGMERFPALADCLEALAQAPVPVHFLPGNRDFLVGPELARATGVLLSAEETRVPGSGAPAWLLLHGDQLCTRDRVYARTRRLLRSRAVARMAAVAPFRFKLLVARLLRARSRRGLPQRPQAELAPAGEAVASRLSGLRVEGLVCGHTHRFGRFTLPGEDRPVLHVLPPWEETGAWALLAPGGLECWDGSGRPLPWPEPEPLCW